jgi:hypothetical protein
VKGGPKTGWREGDFTKEKKLGNCLKLILLQHCNSLNPMTTHTIAISTSSSWYFTTCVLNSADIKSMAKQNSEKKTRYPHKRKLVMSSSTTVLLCLYCSKNIYDFFAKSRKHITYLSLARCFLCVPWFHAHLHGFQVHSSPSTLNYSISLFSLCSFFENLVSTINPFHHLVHPVSCMVKCMVVFMDSNG